MRRQASSRSSSTVGRSDQERPGWSNWSRGAARGYEVRPGGLSEGTRPHAHQVRVVPVPAPASLVASRSSSDGPPSPLPLRFDASQPSGVGFSRRSRVELELHMTLTLRTATIAALALLAAPLAAEAQRVENVPRVALIVTTTPLSEMTGPNPVHPRTKAFIARLRELGYVEGRNIVIERRSAEGKFERFGDIITELLRSNVSVMVTRRARRRSVGSRCMAAAPLSSGSRPRTTRSGLTPIRFSPDRCRSPATRRPCMSRRPRTGKAAPSNGRAHLSRRARPSPRR